MHRLAARIVAAALSGGLLTGGSYLIAHGIVAGSTPPPVAIQELDGMAEGSADSAAAATSSSAVPTTAAPSTTSSPSDSPVSPSPPVVALDTPVPPEQASGVASVDLHLANTPDYHGVWASYTLPQGQAALADTLVLTAENVDLRGCTLTHRAALDDADLTVRTTSMPVQLSQPVELPGGEHTFVITCATPDGTVSDDYRIQVADRLPKRCKDVVFTPGPLTTSTTGELRDAMTGSWEGCVTTPWTPPYWVSIQFRPDGTYSAVSNEVLDGQDMNALYYGTEADDPGKRYAIDDVRDGTGTGTIDIVFWPGNTNRAILRDIRMMGYQLSFEMNYGHGPQVFELHRR